MAATQRIKLKGANVEKSTSVRRLLQCQARDDGQQLGSVSGYQWEMVRDGPI